MGKVRTRKVKVYAKEIFEKYPDQVTISFEENKKIVGILLKGQVSKKLRNRVAGYLTALTKKLEQKRREGIEASPPDKEEQAVKQGSI